MSTKGVEDVGGSGEVKHQLCRSRMRDDSYLAMNKSCYGHVPGGICGHAKSKKRPNTVVMKRGYKNCCGTASSKNVSPSPLVHMVIDVVNITVHTEKKTRNS
jgi:hypothetical protein